MAGNTMTLEFAGDADKLQKAAKDADKAVETVGDSALSASKDFDTAAKGSDNYLDKVGKLGAGVEGISGAFDDAGAAVQALADFQSQGVEKAAALARASNDVKQATEDMSQAQRDAKQSTIDSAQAEVDLEQARLDQTTALSDYTKAVKEHGKNSAEARQAQIDLKQAGVDVTQAQEDAKQATRDLSQANIDAEAAQLDLNDAQREAHPPEIQQWADKVTMITPLLSGLTAVVGLATVAQWAMNSALFASPITWIVLAIVALVAVIVLIATKTDWFQRAWRASWGWIKTAAGNTWDFLKKMLGWIGTAFKGIANFITWPFRTAFNLIADAWNRTIGSLHWSVPGWIPGIGGNSISVPNIPRFHSGGLVPGAPGSEMLAVLQAGETVTPAGGGGGTTHIVVKVDRDTLLDVIAKGGRSGGPSFA